MVVIDVLNDAGGRELLQNKYGLRRVPVLAKGDEYAMGQMIEPFAPSQVREVGSSSSAEAAPSPAARSSTRPSPRT